ncbi:MAG: aldo/keto reductase [Thermoproteota archaeon]
MKYRKLGRTGIEVSEIGFGGWGIGGGWGPKDDESAFLALRRAIDLGVNFFDTALVYGDGHSEKLIGKAVRKIRENVVIATKVPPKTYRWPVLPNEPISETFPSEWIIQCTEKSLKNLGTDYVDVQQLHAWTDQYTCEKDWQEAAAYLKEQGMIRAFGVSANDWDPYGPVNLINSGKIDTVQVIYNIFEQRPAERLLPAALDKNVGIIVRVPFEEGLLTGKINESYKFAEGDWRSEWLTPSRIREATRRIKELERFLNEDAPTLAILALKFCLSHPAVSTVIPGMRKVLHVEENCKASDGKLLSEDTLVELKRHAFVHGWEYPWSQK